MTATPTPEFEFPVLPTIANLEAQLSTQRSLIAGMPLGPARTIAVAEENRLIGLRNAKAAAVAAQEAVVAPLKAARDAAAATKASKAAGVTAARTALSALNAVIAALIASVNALLALIADMNSAIAAIPSGPCTEARKASLRAVLAKIGIATSAGGGILNP